MTTASVSTTAGGGGGGLRQWSLKQLHEVIEDICGAKVGLYKLNSVVNYSLEGAWFQPLNPSSEKLASE
jgi:hypothetical protein